MNDELPPIQKTPPFKALFIVSLSLATFIFAGLFLYFFAQATTATNNLKQAKQKSATEAAYKQKQIDDISFKSALEQPYRSYIAPTVLGLITINFPKNWSSRVAESATNTVQINLSATPDFVRYKDDQPQPVALRVRLIKQSINAFIDSYGNEVKSGALRKSNLKLSGVNAVSLAGHYHNESGEPDFVRLVAVPMRDKVLIFTNEDSTYSAQFDSVLTQSKITP